MTPALSAALSRRAILAGAAGLATAVVMRPAQATPARMAAAIDAFTGGVAPTTGGVTLEIPALIENGNAVPIAVSAESAMVGSDVVKAIGVFNERNPLPEVIVFHFTPRSGAARAATRIRLGDSQTIIAIAAMADGRFRQVAVEVTVTTPACVEDQ